VELRPLFTSETPTDPRPDPVGDRFRSLYVRSYLAMRTLVGVIGVLLPIGLVLIDWLGFDEIAVRPSLSSSYYSGTRDMFVGSLAAISVFLVTYKIAEWSWDNLLSIVAGLSAAVVAIFPTERPAGSGIALTPLQDGLGEGTARAVHYVAASVFILSLGAICVRFGQREGSRRRRATKQGPEFWQWFHWTCAGVIALAVVFIVVSEIADAPKDHLFWGESISVFAFGASWFAKGFELDVLLGREPVPTVD
jgi:hypothetical protein